MKLLLPCLLRPREKGSSTATLDSDKLIDMVYSKNKTKQNKTVTEPAPEGVPLLNAIGRMLTNVLTELCQKEVGKNNIDYDAETVPELLLRKNVLGNMACHHQM